MQEYNYYSTINIKSLCAGNESVVHLDVCPPASPRPKNWNLDWCH